jgi:hypothetical protein
MITLIDVDLNANSSHDRPKKVGNIFRLGFRAVKASGLLLLEWRWTVSGNHARSDRG